MSFERDLSIIKEVEGEITSAGRKLGVNIDRRAVLETPRDTGSAKASWLVSTNQPVNNAVDWSGDVGAAEAKALAQGASEASQFKSGDTLYIQNNQSYIERLNEGYSLQAGSGYIDDIINEEVARAD